MFTYIPSGIFIRVCCLFQGSGFVGVVDSLFIVALIVCGGSVLGPFLLWGN